MNLRRRAAWSVPVVAAGAVAAAALLPQVAASGKQPDLPARTAAELLVAVQSSSTTALSGTVVQTARLGLPDLPGSGDSAALTLQNLASGSHNAQVWVDGPERQRIAVRGSLAQSDVVHNGRDLWTYTSATKKVTHDVAPADTGDVPSSHAPSGDARDLTPQAAAQRALAAIEPTTVVTVDNTAYVAGRSVYSLRLNPRDSRSTVRSVLLAVDSKTSVPLRVQVFGASAEPALETGFTDVSFSRPPARVFDFTPPKGASVVNRTHPAPKAAKDRAPAAGRATGTTPTVLGKGWTSVLVVPGVTAPTAATGSQSAALLERLTVRRADGSRLLRTALVNALLTPDGRLLVGAVTPEALQSAADATG